jgi:hypothetical protein
MDQFQIGDLVRNGNHIATVTDPGTILTAVRREPADGVGSERSAPSSPLISRFLESNAFMVVPILSASPIRSRA